MNPRALCAGRWWLFDSTNPGDHMQAAALCQQCPIRAECAERTAAYRRSPGVALEGTWAGRLYGARTRERIRYEEAMFTDEEARLAHNAFNRAAYADRTRSALGDRIVMGERVYQRRVKRERRDAV